MRIEVEPDQVEMCLTAAEFRAEPARDHVERLELRGHVFVRAALVFIGRFGRRHDVDQGVGWMNRARRSTLRTASIAAIAARTSRRFSSARGRPGADTALVPAAPGPEVDLVHRAVDRHWAVAVFRDDARCGGAKAPKRSKNSGPDVDPPGQP